MLMLTCMLASSVLSSVCLCLSSPLSRVCYWQYNEKKGRERQVGFCTTSGEERSLFLREEGKIKVVDLTLTSNDKGKDKKRSRI